MKKILGILVLVVVAFSVVGCKDLANVGKSKDIHFQTFTAPVSFGWTANPKKDIGNMEDSINEWLHENDYTIIKIDSQVVNTSDLSGLFYIYSVFYKVNSVTKPSTEKKDVTKK